MARRLPVDGVCLRSFVSVAPLSGDLGGLQGFGVVEFTESFNRSFSLSLSSADYLSFTLSLGFPVISAVIIRTPRMTTTTLKICISLSFGSNLGFTLGFIPVAIIIVTPPTAVATATTV